MIFVPNSETFLETFWIDSDKKNRPKFFDLTIFSQFWPFLAEKQSPTKKNHTGKNFRFQDFRFRIRIKTFWIDSDKKNFDQNFLNLPFFTILAKKRLSPGKKFVMGKIFDFEIFILKYVSKHSESFPTKKTSTKIFWLCHFYTILVILGKKWLSPTEKFCNGKKFDFEIFVSKYFSKHSESIPTKNFFRPKFFDSAIFSLFWSFWAKNDLVPRKNVVIEKKSILRFSF